MKSAARTEVKQGHMRLFRIKNFDVKLEKEAFGKVLVLTRRSYFRVNVYVSVWSAVKKHAV
jgi:hypothetical protein